MSAYDDFDRSVARWLEGEAQASAPARLPDAFVERSRRMRPRPAWVAGVGSHWIDEPVGALPRLAMPARTVFVVLLVIAALVAGVLLVGVRLIHPTPRPRLGHLAYGLDGSVYLADWDGANPVRIADGALDPGGAGPGGCGSFWGEGAIWAPDGRHLAYRGAWDQGCAGTTGAGKVFIADADGHVVTSVPGGGWKVAWSPDSTRFATWLVNGSGDIGQVVDIFGLDGVLQTQLNVPSDCREPGDFDPRWSPDGASVTVWPCVVPIDGGTPHRPAPNDPEWRDGWPYSPDRTRVLYANGPDLTIVPVHADTGQLIVPIRPIRDLGASSDQAVWLPSGDRVAYVVDIGRADELRLMDVASGNVTTVVTVARPDQLERLAVSPAGDRFMYATDDANFVGTGLWTVALDGSAPRLLVAGTDWGDWQVTTDP